MLDNIKRYAVIAVIGVLTLSLGMQTIRLAESRVETAHEHSLLLGSQKEASDLRAQRFELEAATTRKLADLAALHGQAQQEILYAFNQKAADIRAAASRDRLDAVRLRDQVAAFAAGGDSGSGSLDQTACRSYRDKSIRLGALLGEGVELVTEGRSLVERQANEIDLLKKLDTNDQETRRP